MHDGEERRRKKGLLLLSLALLLAALVLTMINLPGPRQARGLTAPPGMGQPTPGTTQTPSPAATSTRPSGGGSNLSCEILNTDQGVGVACPKAFAISGNSYDGLYPGNTLELKLTVSNPISQSIRVTSLSVSAAGTATCSASNLQTTNFDGSPEFIVPARGSATITLPITMVRSAPDGCQGVTFTLTYTGKAEKA